MTQNTFLVTGATSGVGKALAIQLVQRGGHVIAVCRNAEKGQALREQIIKQTQSQSIDILIADLSSQADVKQLIKTILAKYDRLDCLINNAGSVIATKTFSVDHIEMTLATNHLGPLQLTLGLLDLLKKSTPARIINISSAIHRWARLDLTDLNYERRTYRAMKVYAQSKLLMNLTSFELARRLTGTGVSVNCIHPGAVKTQLGSNNANSHLLKIIDRFIKFFFISAEDAAKPIVDLAFAPHDAAVTGLYFEKRKSVRASRQCYDTTLAKSAWDTSIALIGDS